MFNRKGFTLAEVLITLGVIGVVAAMTLPSLVASYKEKAIVTQLKKSYSTLSQALLMTIKDNSTLDNWDMRDYVENDTYNSSTDFNNFVKELNIAKNCGYEAKGCFAAEYKSLNDANERDYENLSRYNKVVLADGTSLAIEGYSKETCTSADLCGEIWVDVNGLKKPNVVGKDMFLFAVRKNKIESYFVGSIQIGDLERSNCAKNSSGYSCVQWVLANENMDYLHCDDLNWETKTKCK